MVFNVKKIKYHMLEPMMNIVCGNMIVSKTVKYIHIPKNINKTVLKYMCYCLVTKILVFNVNRPIIKLI